MAERGWSRVADLDEIPQAPPFLVVAVDDVAVMVLRDGAGTVRAVAASCPHLGSSLRTGEVTGTMLECTRHFYAYDLVTGANRFPGDPTDAALRCHDVRVHGDAVWVRPRRGASRHG